MNKVSLKDFLEIFKGAVDKHKDTNDPLPEINSYSLDKIDSYLKMPFQFVFGQELYPSIYDKASILIYIFIKNHPLSNGNKRMAFLTMYYFLYINNIDLNLSENEAYNLTKYIAKSDANKKDETMKYIKSKIKDKKNPQNKVKKVMHEFKEGELHIGKSDKIVKNPKQAVAIALSQANASKMADGGDIGFIPMDLEQELYNIAKRGGVKSIKDVIDILNAIVDTNLKERDFELPTSKSGIKYQKNLDEKTKEIWDKIEPNYKGDLKGNRYFSSLRLIIEKGYDLIKRYKPFNKYQNITIDKMADGGGVWTKEQREKVAKLDKEFEEYVKEKGIQRNSYEASLAWREGGFKKRMGEIFGKEYSKYEKGGDIGECYYTIGGL